jgi:hypothetical protein
MRMDRDERARPGGFYPLRVQPDLADVSIAAALTNLTFTLWRLANRADAHAYLMTARRYGRNVDWQMGLQLQTVVDGSTVEKHWRRVAARPF